ncbi:Dual oxidase 1 [Balamuthia mandrillaris]
MSQLGSLADGLCVRDPDVLAGSRPQIKKEELKHFVRQVHVDEQWIQDFLKRFRGLEEQQLNTYLTEHTSFHLEEDSMYSSAEEGEGGSSRSNTSCSMPSEHVQQQNNNKNRCGSSTNERSSCSGGRSSGSRRVASLTKKLARRGKKLDGKGEEFLYMIEKQQFKELLGIKSDKLADSLYHAFDTHGTGRINVREFLDGVIALSPLSNSDPTTKLRYAFSIYDVDGDGFVTYEELEEMLQESIKENSLQIRPENFVELVDTLFELLDKDVDGLISYEDFETTLLEHIPQAKKITLGGKGAYAEDSHRDLDLFFSESGVHFLKGSRSQGSSTKSNGSSTFLSHKPQEAEEEEYADDEEEEYDEEESDEEHPDCEKRKQLKEKRKAGLERRRQIQSRNFEREKKREEMEELYRKMEEKFHEKREKMLRKQEELKASKEEKKRSKKWQSRKPKHEEDTSPQITDREQSYTVDEYYTDFQGFLTQEGEDRKGQRTSRSGTQGMLLSSQKLLLRLTTQDNPAEEFGVIKDNDIQQFADKEQVPEWVEQLKTYSMHVEDFMPPPIARTRRAAVKRYLHVHGLQVMWLTFYAIINILLFCGWFAMFRWSDSFSLLSYGGPVARGFSVVLAFNSTLILLTVSRNVITWLRSTWLADYIPFDNNIDFHRIVAAVIVLAGVGHTGAHLWNVYAISSATNLQEIDDAINNDFDAVPEYWRVLFGSIPGATGIVIWLCIIVIYVTAQQRFRRLKFEIFWYTHHLFIIFYVALLIHGAAAMLTFPTFWIWFLFPGLTYLTERILRIARHKNDTRVIRAIHKPSRVLALEMKRPKNFQYKPGQYVFINCPAIACHEWHPFTLTSSPLESGILSVHIRALGNWTTKIHAHFEQKEGETLMSQEEFLRRRTMRIRVDGPFGAPCENIFSYKYVMLIGAGIGITPFASVLKTIHLMLQRAHPITLEKAMLFWVNRDQRCFEWFEDLLRGSFLLAPINYHPTFKLLTSMFCGCGMAEDVTQTREARRLIKTRTYLTGATNKNDLRSFLLWTGLEAAYLRDGIDLITGLHSRTHWGRPNWGKCSISLLPSLPPFFPFVCFTLICTNNICSFDHSFSL